MAGASEEEGSLIDKGQMVFVGGDRITTREQSEKVDPEWPAEQVPVHVKDGKVSELSRSRVGSEELGCWWPLPAARKLGLAPDDNG